MLLTFVVPIAFFSIFALIFGGGVGGDATPRIKVTAVDLARTPESAAALAELRDNDGLRFMGAMINGKEATATHDPVASEARARDGVRRGNVTVAIVLEPGEHGIRARLLADSSDQIAGQLVSALVQRAVVVSNSQRLVGTPRVRFQSPDRPASGETESAPLPQPPDELDFMTASVVAVEDVMRGETAKSVVSMYAAGIAVMFLLFGATGGGGALLEEQENRTLDRLFATRLTMDELLLGKWFYLTALGVLQTTLMFLWGQFVFGVDLFSHFDGFVVMTLVTAGAAASFGLLLATVCRTRGQLNGLSVILVLTMSALGGSMVPRYIMSEHLQRAGLWTFNAWALDGYNKVFWRDLPVSDLWPQMSVLMVCGFVFLILARMLAVRWETD